MAFWNRAHHGMLVGPTGVLTREMRGTKAPVAAGDAAAGLAAIGPAPARLTLWLADSFCRYAVLKRPPGLRNAAELQAAAASRFRAMFGEVDAWRVSCQASPWHEMDFVAGVDGELLATLLAQAAAARIDVVSVRPLWLAWAAHFARQTRRGRHWVLGEFGGWRGVGYIEDGICRHARALRAEDGLDGLDDLLARERAFVADADPAAPLWIGGRATAPARLASGAAVSCVGEPAPWSS